MADNINKVMITSATRNNTTVSYIILFVGDNVINTYTMATMLYNIYKS